MSGRSYRQLEAEHYASDARRRHAAFQAQITGFSLGVRASILLVAAADAQLQAPTAADYRDRLEGFVMAEVRRLYPPRPEQRWQILEVDSRHHQILLEVLDDEARALERAVPSNSALSERIDAFGSRRMERKVTLVCREVRARLSLCMSQGWRPDPERYRREVGLTALVPAQERIR